MPTIQHLSLHDNLLLLSTHTPASRGTKKGWRSKQNCRTKRMSAPNSFAHTHKRAHTRTQQQQEQQQQQQQQERKPVNLKVGSSSRRGGVMVHSRNASGTHVLADRHFEPPPYKISQTALSAYTVIYSAFLEPVMSTHSGSCCSVHLRTVFNRALPSKNAVSANTKT